MVCMCLCVDRKTFLSEQRVKLFVYQLCKALYHLHRFEHAQHTHTYTHIYTYTYAHSHKCRHPLTHTYMHLHTVVYTQF